MSTITATTPNWNVIAPQQTSNTSLIRSAWNLFQDSGTPLIVKIVTATLAAFATLAAGYLLGSVLLCTSMMATTVVLTAGMESKCIENEATIEAQKREIAHLEVNGLMGGMANIREHFEDLDLGDREFATGAIDLQLNEISAPTRGVDKYRRHFYAIPLEKLSDRSRHLIVLYEKYTKGNVWGVIGPQDLIRDPLTHEGKIDLGLLMLREHENYRYLVDV